MSNIFSCWLNGCLSPLCNWSCLSSAFDVSELSFILEKLLSFSFKYSTYSLEFPLWSHFFPIPSVVSPLSLKGGCSSGFYPNSLFLPFSAYSSSINLLVPTALNIHKCWYPGHLHFWVSDPHLQSLDIATWIPQKHFKLIKFPDGSHLSLSFCDCE